jgi:glutaminyl-tRNA synthetase
VEGVIHWVSAGNTVQTEIRLYDRLFQIPDPAEIADNIVKYLNPASLETLTSCYVEASLKNAPPGSRYQFERVGYFCVDSKDSSPGKPVFNRIVPLRDSWAKLSQGKV